MKLGMLYGNHGTWNGEVLLDSVWISRSFTEQIEFPSNVSEGNDGYGYQFWMWPDTITGKEVKIVAAIGNGGQNIYWDRGNGIVVVTTAGNYNNWEIENDAYSMVRSHIYPALYPE